MSREAHVRFCEGVEVKFLCATRPLVCSIDCGFDTWHRERLRLRFINAPERNTVAGQKTKRFLQEILSEVDFVILKTYGIDIYGRYLADVFYLPGEADAEVVAAKGQFLNQALLDSKMVDYVL